MSQAVVQDRAIVGRFVFAEGSVTQEYLRRVEALLAECEWCWGSRDQAYVWESHQEADEWCRRNTWRDGEGNEHTAFAIVLERKPRRDASGPNLRPAVRRAPHEAFEALERRGLA